MRSNIKPIVPWSVATAACSILLFWASLPATHWTQTSRIPEACFLLIVWTPYAAIAAMEPMARLVARDPQRVSDVVSEAQLVTVLMTVCLLVLLLVIFFDA